MLILKPFKRKYFEEAQDELFSGEDMLPFVSFTYTEEVKPSISKPGLNFPATKRKFVLEKVSIYFWQNIVKKVFKL